MMLKNLSRYIDPERIRQQVPLKDYTTFRVGGPAAMMINVNTSKELSEVISYLKKCQADYFILGNGSNLLVSDKGYDGIVIKLSGELTDISANGDVITAGAGALLSNVCKKALEESLTGLEFAFGIPGTVGGAIVMNAGAYDGETGDVVDGVEAVNADGEIMYVSPHSLRFGYRKSDVKKAGLTVVKVDFRLKKGNYNDIRLKMKELLESRIEKQPLEFPSAGSTFKRPEGTFAGKLISEAGLSGYRIGGACVSEKHNGFIVNDRQATAKDISDLIEYVKKSVYEHSSVKLEPEVIRLGKF
ncbi:MAG: UDP-N-acetylmuramate dehydrogenase [Lachnospiraceae bacterium]|nr:UDP-N-acetylmuramate dehydrogenase [Lachnospiraceae bacterium]